MPQVKVGWRSGAVAAPSVSTILLDVYSGAAAAYSLRKLKSSYTGSAIRVRRSSDNTELNIGFDANGDLDTYALSAFVGSGNGFVTTWYDQSGSGNNATQTTASSQPRIVNAGIIETVGGKPAVRWLVIGGLEMVLSMNTSLSNVRSVFLNITYLSGIARVPLLGHTTAYDYHSDADVYLSSQYAANYVKNGSNYINGVSKTLATFAKSSSNSLITMIHTSASGNVNQISSDRNIGRWDWSVFTGYFSEIILYSSDQTTNRINIESNINSYYSIYPNPTSVWNLLAAAYNADSIGSPSLKTSLFAAYNGESNTNDSFGTNNGTAVGGLTYTTGKIGNAFQFNGSNSVVELPTNSMNFTGDFSFSFFVNLASNAGSQCVFSNEAWAGGQNDKGYIISFEAGKLTVYLYNGSSSGLGTVASTTTVSANQWYHFSVVKVGQQIKIYCNGTLENTLTFTGSIAYRTPDTFPGIGALYKQNASNSYFFLSNGSKVDAFNVWNRAITQSEIIELYNSGNGAQYIGDNFYKPTPNDALNTYNGTAQGGLTYAPGKVGTAFQFNGSNSLVSLPTNSMKFTGDFSYSFWVNLASLGGYPTLISNYRNAGGDYGYIIRMNPSGKLEFWGFATSTNSFAMASLTTFNTNTWYHVSVTKSASSVKIYVNGVLNITNSVGVPMTYFSTMYPSIGALYNWNGSSSADFVSNGSKIDAIGIWNKELSASEVTELYNSGNGKQYPY